MLVQVAVTLSDLPKEVVFFCYNLQTDMEADFCRKKILQGCGSLTGSQTGSTRVQEKARSAGWVSAGDQIPWSQGSFGIVQAVSTLFITFL